MAENGPRYCGKKAALPTDVDLIQNEQDQVHIGNACYSFPWLIAFQECQSLLMRPLTQIKLLFLYETIDPYLCSLFFGSLNNQGMM